MDQKNNADRERLMQTLGKCRQKGGEFAATAGDRLKKARGAAASLGKKLTGYAEKARQKMEDLMPVDPEELDLEEVVEEIDQEEIIREEMIYNG